LVTHRHSQLLISFEEYLVGCGMSPATVKNYLADINNFGRWCRSQDEDGTGLLRCSSADLRAYRDQMSDEGLSPHTVNRRLQALRKFGQFAIEAGLREQDPARDVDRLRPGCIQSPRVLSDAQAEELLEVVQVRAKPSRVKRDYAIVMTLLTCGLRLRELVDLRLKDVELGVDEGYLMVGASAVEGGRVIPFGMAPTAALKAYLRTRPNVPEEDRLFLSREGRPISPRTVQRMVTRYAEAAGLQDVSVRTLRATFARAMLEGTEDIEAVARLMGHSSPATTARYFEDSSDAL
jgi:integrase/recombinase XerC